MTAVAEPHHEGQHPKLQHHFYSMKQQTSSGKLGMWLFMGNEFLFFSGIFSAYIYLRWSYPEMWLESSHHLDWVLGTFNTVVLLLSSLTMALGVRAAQLGKNKSVLINVGITLLCALIFLVVKYFEYKAKFEHGTLPAHFWSASEMGAPGQPGPWIFFGFYFFVTGIHAIHIIIGVGLLLWVLLRAKRNEFDSEHYILAENVGLYWHFVDIVWIFVFPLFYLVA